MTLFRLVRRSVRFHWRSHLGVILGAAIGSAALIGALVVGDSVRESLKDRARMRLGAVAVAMDTGDRLFKADLGERLEASIGQAAGAPGTGGGGGRGGEPGLIWGPYGQPRARVLALRGAAVKPDGSARAHQVQIMGSTHGFWHLSPRAGELRERTVRALWAGGRVTAMSQDEEYRQWMEFHRRGLGPGPGRARINQALAAQLDAKPGDTVVLRFAKPSALSQDAVLSPRNEAVVAMRVTVEEVMDGDWFGEFSLASGQRAALNAWVNEEELWKASGVTNRANLLLLPGGHEARAPSRLRVGVQRWADRLSPHLPAALGNALRRAVNPQRVPPPAEAEATLAHVTAELARHWRLTDAEIEVRAIEEPMTRTGGESMPPMIEVATRRIFLDEAVGEAAVKPRTRLLRDRPGYGTDDAARLAEASFVTNGVPVLTYLANGLRFGDRLTPYSMVTAAGAPWTPADLGDDEIVVNEWLAKDLGVKVGDQIELTYYDPDAGAMLVERTNRFTVRQVVPLKGLHADRTLMPEFPGLSKAESTQDWDAGFPLEHEIRDEDEAYWKAYRGTPKAFVSEAAGRAMWGNRFGHLTAVRYPLVDGVFPSGYLAIVEANLLANLEPSDVGLVPRSVRAEALRAATSGQDFGGLFLGFSFFLVLAALLLMGLLFQFGVEQRLPEIGTLLAVGFRRGQVRRLWFGEGLVLALVGGVLGAFGGLGYAQAMIRGLGTIWRDAVAGTPLSFYVTPGTLLVGFLASVVVAGVTLAITIRRSFGRPPRELLAGTIATGRLGGRSRGYGVAVVAGVGALGLAAWAVLTGQGSNPGVFFGVGSLVLVAGLGGVAGWLRGMQGGGRDTVGGGALLTQGNLALRGTARRRSRSLATVGLLASGVFLVASLGVFRMDATRDAHRRSSGTGGFALIAESSLPVPVDLNTRSGREHFGLGDAALEGVGFVNFRVREGDDASCLNLDRAQRPRMLGVRPEALGGRGAFRFGRLAKGVEGGSGWAALKGWREEDGRIVEVPAIGDAASIQWALGKSIGDTLEMEDERGRPFRVRLVGGVMNSVLQGSLVIDEDAMVRLFPGVTGYRWFLVDVGAGGEGAVSATLSRALSDVGLEVQPATRRLAELNAVQNTYLSTFQILGGLGVLLGSAGLGVVVLRNVLERRGELALLTAVGFGRRSVGRLVLVEHAALLAAGLGVGLAGAVVAVGPSVGASGADLPWASLGMTLGAVVAFGLGTTWAATRASVRGSLVGALRGE